MPLKFALAKQPYRLTEDSARRRHLHGSESTILQTLTTGLSLDQGDNNEDISGGMHNVLARFLFFSPPPHTKHPPTPQPHDHKQTRSLHTSPDDQRRRGAGAGAVQVLNPKFQRRQMCHAQRGGNLDSIYEKRTNTSIR
ncbi:hypothetical protein JOB18_008607 [Solea senegalensis]|uniref:Uncharacterized protein n=1 Tax=Solea senegalensis TaxID=28829 RepID=A0AAV6SYF6_SOLSE|nr:hypothetical protein JOB18_008607 [Solea senegalensis]